MQSVIYSSHEHRAIIEGYMAMCLEFAKDASTESRYYNYLDVVSIIIEYSNNYGKRIKENGNFYDWLAVLPINLSVATNGFFAGIETKTNAAVVRAYKVVLEQALQDTIDKINSLDAENE
jgi:hypothetical protein